MVVTIIRSQLKRRMKNDLAHFNAFPGRTADKFLQQTFLLAARLLLDNRRTKAIGAECTFKTSFELIKFR